MLGWQASREVMISLRFYQKTTQINTTLPSEVHLHNMNSFLTRSYRFGMAWPASAILVFKTSVEAKMAGPGGTQPLFGYLAYQDLQVKMMKWLETLSFRLAIFDIPSYESRIYVYEPQVLYGYSVPAYQGRGLRTCLVSKFRISRHMDVWLRGGVTYYTDRQTVGTGMDLTDGNIRSDLTAQVMVRF
jgi:hypothetical protein